jgi:hypothetical protein
MSRSMVTEYCWSRNYIQGTGLEPVKDCISEMLSCESCDQAGLTSRVSKHALAVDKKKVPLVVRLHQAQ